MGEPRWLKGRVLHVSTAREEWVKLRTARFTDSSGSMISVPHILTQRSSFGSYNVYGLCEFSQRGGDLGVWKRTVSEHVHGEGMWYLHPLLAWHISKGMDMGRHISLLAEPWLNLDLCLGLFRLWSGRSRL